MSRFVSLGAQVTAQGLPPALLRALRDLWEDPPGRLPTTENHVLVQAGKAPPVPANVPSERLNLIEREVDIQRQGDELWLPGLHLQVRPDGAALTFTAEAAGSDALELWSLAFTELHRARGWVPLHAALFVSGGRAVALTGVSGAGKSTATLRLLQGGYAALAEDRAFWHPSGQVAGLDRHVRAFPDSVERFAPALLPGALSGARDAKGKLLLPLPAAPGEAVLAGALLLSDGPLLSPPERVRVLWETTGWPLTVRARAQVQRGVGALLPLLSPQPARRSDVLERVKAFWAGS